MNKNNFTSGGGIGFTGLVTIVLLGLIIIIICIIMK